LTVLGSHAPAGRAAASILLSPILGLLFVVARGGLLGSLWFYWLTVAMVRAAGTAVGDLVASRGMLGLPLSTLVTGVIFVGLLIAWKEAGAPKAGRGRYLTSLCSGQPSSLECFKCNVAVMGLGLMGSAALKFLARRRRRCAAQTEVIMRDEAGPVFAVVGNGIRHFCLRYLTVCGEPTRKR
jgi:hypothetical protein